MMVQQAVLVTTVALCFLAVVSSVPSAKKEKNHTNTEQEDAYKLDDDDHTDDHITDGDNEVYNSVTDGDDAEDEDNAVFRRFDPDDAGNGRTMERVAFFVRRTWSLLAGPSIIKFREVVVNEGNGWNIDKDVFVVPVSGLYFFSFHTVTNGNFFSKIALMANEEPQLHVYGTLSFYDGSSGSCVLQLEAGSVVYLQLVAGSLYEHFSNDVYTAFSGFLVTH